MKKLIFFLAIMLNVMTIAARNWFVVPVGADGLIMMPGNGTSWSDYTTLSNALKLATSGDIIYAKQGVHEPLFRGDGLSTPNTGEDARYSAFTLKPNVKIYGGYSSSLTGTSTSGRNPELYPTILSGRAIIGYTYGPHILQKYPIYANTYHTVISSGDVGTACLDGFIIRQWTENNVSYNSNSMTVNGNTVYNDCGGGICVIQSKPTLKNLKIENCTSRLGGGLYAQNCPTGFTLNHVTLQYNNAATGGGAYIVNNTINTATPQVRLDSCRFNENTASTSGGGGLYIGSTYLVIDSASFFENAAQIYGGGLYSDYSKITADQLSLISNRSGLYGGGLYTYYSYKQTFRNMYVSYNRAQYGGGLYFSYKHSSDTAKTIIEIIQALINDNVTQSETGGNPGAGIYLNNLPINKCVSIIQSTIVKNECRLINGAPHPSFTGGIYTTTGDTLKLQNSIIAGNSGSSTNASNKILSHCAIQGGGTGVNIYNWTLAQIHFVDTVLKNYKLKSYSPCCDKGDNLPIQGLLNKDLTMTNNRIYGSKVDLGAYENQGSLIGAPSPGGNQNHFNEERAVSDKMDLFIYPNVVEKGQNIHLQLQQGVDAYSSPISVDIYSINGAKVHSTAYSSGHAEFSVPNITSGIYIVFVRNQEGTTFNKKIVVR